MIVTLKNKNAIVCGSSQGIGKAIALQFAESGANVTLLARNEESLKKVLQELKNENQNHNVLVADFDNSDNLYTIINDYINNNPPVHILVNNTGGPNPGLAIDANVEDYFCAFNRHLICNQILTKAVSNGMKKENYGRIINIISTSVKQPIQGLGVSNTIRGAVANWAKTLSSELGAYGITVNNILPGATATQRLENIISNKSKKLLKEIEEIEKELKNEIPAGRFGLPEELAFAVTFLASDKASYINGINLPVDGGRTLSL